jgi:hypothetical protein
MWSNMCYSIRSLTHSLVPEPEGSSLCSQELAIGPCPEPTESTPTNPPPPLPPISLRSILNPTPYLRLNLLSGQTVTKYSMLQHYFLKINLHLIWKIKLSWKLITYEHTYIHTYAYEYMI